MEEETKRWEERKLRLKRGLAKVPLNAFHVEDFEALFRLSVPAEEHLLLGRHLGQLERRLREWQEKHTQRKGMTAWLERRLREWQEKHPDRCRSRNPAVPHVDDIEL